MLTLKSGIRPYSPAVASKQKLLLAAIREEKNFDLGLPVLLFCSHIDSADTRDSKAVLHPERA